MTPVGLPIATLDREFPTADTGGVVGIFFEGGHDGLLAAEARFFNSFQRLQHAFVILWHHFYKLRRHLLPFLEDFGRSSAVSIGLVPLNEFPKTLDFIRILQLLQLDHLLIA